MNDGNYGYCVPAGSIPQDLLDAYDASSGCWKYETRASNHFGNSPFHEKSWKKQDFSCDCGCAETVTVNGVERRQETFPDCSRAYVGARRGCTDPGATNYDAKAELEDHSCKCGGGPSRPVRVRPHAELSPDPRAAAQIWLGARRARLLLRGRDGRGIRLGPRHLHHRLEPAAGAGHDR